MQKLRVKPLLACLSIVAIPLLASTAQANTRDINLYCSNGNFEGEAVVNYANIGYLSGKSYKIEKSNNQQGGNKANINLKVLDANTGHQYLELKSPDNRLQNNTWQSLDLEGPVPKDRPLVLVAQFIFDKTGADPKCESRASLNTSWDTKPGTVSAPSTPPPTGSLIGSTILMPK